MMHMVSTETQCSTIIYTTSNTEHPLMLSRPSRNMAELAARKVKSGHHSQVTSSPVSRPGLRTNFAEDVQ